jgi:hypothetical protein
MWTVLLSMWVLILTTVQVGGPPQVHEVRKFATKEACQAFQQQLTKAYEDIDRRAREGPPRPRPQRLYDCEERQGE